MLVSLTAASAAERSKLNSGISEVGLRLIAK